MSATRTPGVAVAVVRGDSIVYAKGFGVVSLETTTAVTPDTLQAAHVKATLPDVPVVRCKFEQLPAAQYTHHFGTIIAVNARPSQLAQGMNEAAVARGQDRDIRVRCRQRVFHLLVAAEIRRLPEIRGSRPQQAVARDRRRRADPARSWRHLDPASDVVGA